MNQRSDFKLFHMAVKKEKLLNDDHLVFILKNKDRKGAENVFAVTIIKTGNKNIPSIAFIVQLSQRKCYLRKENTPITI